MYITQKTAKKKYIYSTISSDFPKQTQFKSTFYPSNELEQTNEPLGGASRRLSGMEVEAFREEKENTL